MPNYFDLVTTGGYIGKGPLRQTAIYTYNGNVYMYDAVLDVAHELRHNALHYILTY